MRTKYEQPEILAFKNTGELKNQIQLLDTGRQTTVYYYKGEGTPDGLAKTTDYIAIENKNKGTLATIQSKHYSLVQHKEAFGDVADTLDRLNLDIKGEILNWGNVVRMNCTFTGITPVIDRVGSEIGIGFSIVNSINGAVAFSGFGYALRLTCLNGMTLKKVIPETAFYHKHTKNLADQISTQLEQFIALVINQSKLLQELVNKAIGTSLEWTLVLRIAPKLLQTKKHRNAILEILKENTQNTGEVEERNITKWELYNAITQYTSHEGSLSRTVQDYLQSKAEQVLEPDFKPELLIEVSTVTK